MVTACTRCTLRAVLGASVAKLPLRTLLGTRLSMESGLTDALASRRVTSMSVTVAFALPGTLSSKGSRRAIVLTLDAG